MAVEWRLRAGGCDVWVRDEVPRLSYSFSVKNVITRWKRWWEGADLDDIIVVGHGSHPHGMHLNIEALSWKQVSTFIAS